MNTPQASDFSDRLAGWLRHVHLFANPFASHEAERESNAPRTGEAPLLSLLFVDRPYLAEIVGNPASPQTTLLMADRGCGKTATRMMVEYMCQRPPLRDRVLVAVLTDFQPLIAQVNGNLSLLQPHHYVRLVLRSALRAMFSDVRPEVWSKLPELDRRFLMAYVREFADPLTAYSASSMVSESPPDLNWATLSPYETLHSFAELAAGVGREAVYVLVDRVDEAPGIGSDPERAVTLLEPLITNQPLLEMPHLAFKFFIPSSVGAALERVIPLRTDRILVRTISWEREWLSRLLQERLKYYSNNYVLSIEDLCVPEARHMVMDKFISASQGSPRALLRLCDALIRYHVGHNAGLLITRTEITQTLREVEHQLATEQERLAETWLDRRQMGEAIEPALVTTLQIDAQGAVYVDGAKLEEDLSPLEYGLLEVLYKRAGRVVNHEELIRVVWAERVYGDWNDDAILTADETSLRKLVSRLRTKLGRGEPGEGTRFVQTVRGRGYTLRLDAPRRDHTL